MKVFIAQSTKDIKNCYPVMVQLRINLKLDEFVKKFKRQTKSGYKVAFINDKTKVVAVAGFRILENLAHGKFIYIDDLITDSANRSKGYGDKPITSFVPDSLPCR